MASAMEEDGDTIAFKVSEQPLDVTFHPTEPIVFAGEPPAALATLAQGLRACELRFVPQ